MEDKGYFSIFVCIDPFWHTLSVSCDKKVLFLIQGWHFSRGKFYNPLIGRGERSWSPSCISVVSQVPSPQTNQHSRLLIFRVTCSKHLYLFALLIILLLSKISYVLRSH